MKKIKNPFHSVSAKLVVEIAGLSVLTCCTLGYLTYKTTSAAIEDYIKSDLQSFATNESYELGLTLKDYVSGVEKIAADDRIKSMDFSIQQPLMIEKIEQYGYDGMSVADVNGDLKIFNGNTTNIAEMESFKRSIKGESIISEPMKDKADETRSFMPISVPIYNDNNKIVGRLAADFNTDFINAHIDDVYHGSTGYSFVVNKEGDLIATNKNPVNFALNPANLFDIYSENNDAKQAYTEALNSDEKQGFVRFTDDSEIFYAGYSVIPGTEWYIFTATPRDEVRGVIFAILSETNIVTFLSIIVSAIVALYIGKSIRKPLGEIKNFAKSLSNNDLTYRIDIASKDEFGDVSIMLNDAIENLQNIMNSVKESENTTLNLISSTNENIDKVNSMIQNVSSGTEEISSSMQESSAAIEQITAQIINAREFGNEIDEQSKKNSLVAKDIKNISKQILEDTEKSKDEIFEKYELSKEKLDLALKKVEVINQISVMAETINNIASQTNLLSLNASIEAARAGENGRGFAVVAEEVRKLAEESASTASGIQQVMNNVIESVNELAVASKDVLDSMKNSTNESYEKIVTISSEYSSTGETIGEMTSTLELEASKIANALNEIVENVTSLSTAMEDVSSNADTIANDVSKITTEVQSLSNASIKNIEVSTELSESMNNFKTK